MFKACYTVIRGGMKRNIYTREELQEVFRINSEGLLERLCLQTNQSGKKGEWKVVECKANTTKGYCDVRFQGTMIKYHVILYVLHHGTIEDASAVIDHKNGDKIDNRIENLRLVTNRKNQQNRTAHRNGRLTGCCLDKRWNKWMARIQINGKQINLGYSDTELEANQIYLTACELIGQYVDAKQFRTLLKSYTHLYP